MPFTINLTRDGIIAALRPVNPGAAFLNAVARMDEKLAAYEAQGAIRRSKERRARRQAVKTFSDPANYDLLLSWLSQPIGGRFQSVEQAVASFRRRLARLRYARKHDLRCPALSIAAPAMRDRLVVATYFARHGAAIWQREAA